MKKERPPQTHSTESTAEKREGASYPTYDVMIDKERLALARPEGIPEDLKERFMRLPETLTFKDQVVLIVGENGSGKTALARAIFAARARSLKEQNPGARTNDFLLDNEEPAATLQEILAVKERRDNADFLSIFIEGTEVMSEIRKWAKEEAYRNQGDRAEDLSGGAYTHSLSSRQLFEQATHDIKKMGTEFNKGFPHVDLLFDEPEQGLSPQRQIDLPAQLPHFVDEKDTLLVPTNNLALFLSDLPRIDLNYPERGVFRPSEYGESGEIIFRHKEDDK